MYFIEMHLGLRRRLLYFLTFIFIVVGSGAVLYAQGWRLDRGDFSIEKIGGIYVRSFPPRAEIYLDNKAIRREYWFFQEGTLINNLLPKDHKLRLRAENYEPWEQTVTVRSSFVTDVEFAVLIPKTRTPLEELQNISAFWVTSSGLILKNEKGVLSLNSQKLPGEEVRGISRDGRTLLLFEPAEKAYFLYTVSGNSALNITQILKNQGLDAKKLLITLDKEDPDTLILPAPSEIYQFSLRTRRLSTLTQGTSSSILPQSLSSSRAFIAWTETGKVKNSSSTLIIFNKTSREKDNFITLTGKTKKMEWYESDRVALLLDNGDFYMGDPFSRNLDKIASDAEDFAFAPNLSFVAVRQRSAVEIFPLRNSESKTRKRFALPDAGKIKNLTWHKDERHLFVTYENRIMFLDINDPKLEHFALLANTPQGAYDLRANRFYYLEGQKLLRMDFAE